MGKPILILMVGLPRSGKTTWARKFVSGHTAAIVCPDAIRIAIHGKRFVGSFEPQVWQEARRMVCALFIAGHDFVILDSTNITNKRRKIWEKTCYEINYAPIDTSEEKCVKRALKEGRTDLIPVIQRMAKEKEPLKCKRVQLWHSLSNY